MISILEGDIPNFEVFGGVYMNSPFYFQLYAKVQKINNRKQWEQLTMMMTMIIVIVDIIYVVGTYQQIFPIIFQGFIPNNNNFTAMKESELRSYLIERLSASKYCFMKSILKSSSQIIFGFAESTTSAFPGSSNENKIILLFFVNVCLFLTRQNNI